MLIQRVEAFETSLENTDGLDLYRILWLKSANSEVTLNLYHRPDHFSHSSVL
jgi:FKBP12-rapamycin complex-associated protein